MVGGSSPLTPAGAVVTLELQGSSAVEDEMLEAYIIEELRRREQERRREPPQPRIELPLPPCPPPDAPPSGDPEERDSEGGVVIIQT